MNKIALLTDSASDISCEVMQKYNIRIIPLRIHFSNCTYRDRVDITPHDLYDLIVEEIPKTSLPSSEDIIPIFEAIKKEGYEKILYIGISSGLSGTYNFVKMLGKEYWGDNFYSIDTKTLSSGEGLLVQKAADMLDNQKDIKEIFQTLSDIRGRMFSAFVVRDISYLSRGGRIGKVAGTLGSLFKICPVIRVNDDGVYETSGKSIGFTRSLQLMIKQVQDKFSGLKIAIEIVHGLEESTAKSVLDKIKQFSDIVKEAIIPVTAVLGVHTGPGLIGIIAYEV